MIENILVTTENYAFDFYSSKYILKNKDTRLIDENIYNNATCKETIKFFKSLGGKEFNKKSHTQFGYRITKNISTSPGGDFKTIRTYDFSEAFHKGDI